YVLKLLLVQLGAEACVVAVGRVGEDRRGRDLPSGRLRAEVGGKRRLRLETDLLGDLRLAPPLLVVAPFLGQIQRPAQRQRAPPPDCAHADRDLAVTDLAERARVLALHPR